MEALGILVAGTEHIDGHTLGHRFGQVGDIEVEDVELRPCVPVEV